jgi:hypothetical protein
MRKKTLLTLPSLLVLLITLVMLLSSCGEQTELRQAVTAASSPQAMLSSSTTIPSTNTPATTQQTSTVVPIVGLSDQHPLVVTTLSQLAAPSSLVVIGKVSGLGEIVNEARDPNDPSKPDSHLFIVGQIYHLTVESYLKGQGSNNLDFVATEGVLTATDPLNTPTSQYFEQAKAKDQHIPLVIGERYLLFLSPEPAFMTQHYFGITKDKWGYKLPLNGTAHLQSFDSEAKKYFPDRPSADLVTEVKQIIGQSPTVAVPTSTPNILAKQTVNLTKLYGLDKASSLLLKGRPLPDNYVSHFDLKVVINSLNQDVTVLENSPQTDVSPDIVYMVFSFADNTSIGFAYNIKTSTLIFTLPDKVNWIKVVAPSQLLQAIGLDKLSGLTSTLPTSPTIIVGTASNNPTKAGTIPNIGSTDTGGISAIKPHLNMANASTVTNIATFTEDDVRQFLTAYPSLGLIKSTVPFTIEKIQFSSAGEATTKIGTSVSNAVGTTNDKLVCLVTLRGKFEIMGSPPVSGQTVGATITFTHAYMLFDAQTGNLILLGRLPN